MDKLFLSILNMSITGAFVIAAIILVRLPLKKVPKIISYCLWSVAGFRLIFPLSINSIVSLVPFRTAPIPQSIATQAIPGIDSGISSIDNAVSGILPVTPPNTVNSINPLQVWIFIGALVWLAGVVMMAAYGIVSYLLLKRKIRASSAIEVSIYEAKNIRSPFLLGILKPKIYIPAGLTEQERNYVLLHEKIHFRRHDHIVKFAAYFILCLHWFNPFAWAAFILMGADMELSCDERALKEMGGEVKYDYSRTLLSLATGRRSIGGSPLAFAEGGIKERVKNVLRFKKHSRFIVLTGGILAAAICFGLAVNQAGYSQEGRSVPDGAVTANDFPVPAAKTDNTEAPSASSAKGTSIENSEAFAGNAVLPTVERSFNSCSSLKILTVDGNIDIIRGGDQLVIQYNEKKAANEYTLSEIGENITLSQDNPTHYNNSSSSPVKIAIPESMLVGNIDIVTASGNVDIDGVTVKDTLKVQVASSDVNVSRSTFGGTLIIQSASGNSSVTDCQYAGLDMMTASGAGTVNLSDSALNYNIKVIPGKINNTDVNGMVSSNLGAPEFTYNGERISYAQLQNSSAAVSIRLTSSTGSFSISDQ